MTSIAPDLPAVFGALSRWKVRWVLTGSLAAASHGAEFRVRDVDVTPALDVDNLHRVANLLDDLEAHPHWHEKGDLSCEDCRAWTSDPVCERNLDHLFETRCGLVDIVPRLCGRYVELVRRAVPRMAFGTTVLVASVGDVVAAHRAKMREKDHGRKAEYERLAGNGTSIATTGDGRHFRAAPPAESPLLESEDLRAIREHVGAAARPEGVRPVEGVVTEEGYHHRLVRVALDGGRTALVKKANRDDGRLFDEWAGLAFLDGIEAAAPFVPRFLGGDRKRRLVVMEDLGDVRDRDLASLLVGRDRAAAESLLVETMRATGAVQAASFGRGEEYAALRASLPHSSGEHAADRLDEALTELPSFLDGVASDCERAREELDDPAFLVWCRGDACTKNAVATDSGPRLFDLEWGAYRHALTDGAFPAIRHLHCLYAGGFPAPVRDAMESAYRTALCRGCAAAGDDDRWADALAAGAAAWLASIAVQLPDLLEKDVRRARVTQRERLVACLDAFAETSNRTDRLPALGRAAAAKAGELRARWPVRDVPLHPVFGEEA